MAQVIWTEPALTDLDKIAQYIAISNLVAAQKLVSRVFDQVERLATHPASGRIPEELPGWGYREVIVNPCWIFYKIDNDQVFILFVMRQEQQLKRFLLHQRSAGIEH
jgi:toxin ParE1/3/4